MSQEKRWIVKPEIPSELATALADYPPILQQLLYNRGIVDSQSAEYFLSPDKSQFCDPFHLPDMQAAVQRIFEALDQQEKIVVYGDFDVDGITATAVLVEALKKYGANVHPYFPQRLKDGYGLNLRSIDELAADGANLIITVDCGIRSVDEVEHARELGVDFVISDHHSVPDRLPPGVAVVNPKRVDSQYPNPHLAGVGVSYKIVEALHRTRPIPGGVPEDWLHLVAIGTVADIVSLTGENRALVRHGLIALGRCRRDGVNALARVARLNLQSVTATDIGFILGPRLNAAGRLDTALKAYQLITEADISKVGLLAQELDDLNNKRRARTAKIQASIQEGMQASQVNPDEAFLIFALAPAPEGQTAAGPDEEALLNPDVGVVGLAASRLTERYYRPAILGAEIGGTIRASCRSISEFHITQALDECADLLVRHGGHAMAAGFTVEKDRWNELGARLEKIARRELEGGNLEPVLEADLDIPFEELKPGLIAECLAPIEPTGSGNPSVTLLTRGVVLKNVRLMGSEKKHVRMTVSHPAANFVVDGVAFRQASFLEKHPQTRDSRYDLIFNFELNHYRGETSAQLNIIDIHEAQ